MLAYALIELGHVLRCEMEECACATREEFAPNGPRRLSIDHRIAVAEGGSDHPSNLRFAHLCCNIGKGLSFNPAGRPRKSTTKVEVLDWIAWEDLTAMTRELLWVVDGAGPGTHWAWDGQEWRLRTVE
jgi:hypothetical protein